MKWWLVFIGVMLLTSLAWGETKQNFTPKNQHKVEYTDEGILWRIWGDTEFSPHLTFMATGELTFGFKNGQVTMTELLRLLRSINPEICDRIWQKLKETK